MTATNLLPAFNGPALGSSRKLSPIMTDDEIIRVEAQAAGERQLADGVLHEIVAELATLVRHPPAHRGRGRSD